MAAKSGRALLSRSLYLACRNAVDPRHCEDGEMVRVYRAGVCRAVTEETRGEGKGVYHYKQLSLDELRRAVALAESGQKIEMPGAPLEESKPPTAQQLARFRFSVMACAVRYADLGRTVHTEQVGESTVEYSGERLRAFMVTAFNASKLPKSLYAILRSRWVNPTANRFLVEGGFRGPESADSWKFFDHQLTAVECSYLITRFREVQQNSEPAPVALSQN